MRACSVSGQDSHIPLDRRTFLQWLSRWWRGQHESGSPSFSIRYRSRPGREGRSPRLSPDKGACMSEAQSLSYAKAQMANRLRIYQVLFRISIIANLLVGLWCIFDPVGFAQRVFQIDPYPQAWPRIWGATLLGLQFVYIPGALNPLFYRWPNWFSIAIKILMTIISLTAGSSFYLLAAWEFIWFLILLTTYYHLLVADIRANP
jgi:hypothetical protein